MGRVLDIRVCSNYIDIVLVVGSTVIREPDKYNKGKGF